jgi:hypothetical protein
MDMVVDTEMITEMVNMIMETDMAMAVERTKMVVTETEAEEITTKHIKKE